MRSFYTKSQTQLSDSTTDNNNLRQYILFLCFIRITQGLLRKRVLQKRSVHGLSFETGVAVRCSPQPASVSFPLSVCLRALMFLFVQGHERGQDSPSLISFQPQHPCKALQLRSGTSGKESTCQYITDTDLIPGWGSSLGGRHGNLLQYFYLENPMDRGAQWAIFHRVTKN